MNLLMRKEWIGLEKLPAGGFIAAPTTAPKSIRWWWAHMLYNQKRMPRFLAKAGLFKVPVLGFVLRATRQIPVERSTAGANRSLQIAKEVVDEGGAIIIYPEGTLTRDPELWPMKGHTGAARMALESGIPVVPMAHWGAHEVCSALRQAAAPLPAEDLAPGGRRSGGPQRLRRAARWTRPPSPRPPNVIMDAITELLATLRGGQPPLVRWDPWPTTSPPTAASSSGRQTGGTAAPEENIRGQRRMTFDQTRGPSATRVAVLGAGSWGTTFAKVLADAATASGIERDIRLWGRRDEVVEQINLKHRNEQYLKDIALPPSITASTDVAEVLAGAELVVLAVPAQTLRPQLREWKNLLRPAPWWFP